MPDAWTEGDAAVLKHPGSPPVLVRIARGPVRVGDAAVIDLTDQIGRPPGEAIDWVGARYRLVRPSLGDLFTTMTRGAQIITAKDTGRILALASVRPNATVGEAGSGSGGLTLALAHAVGPAGTGVSVDRRPEALRLARENLERAGYAGRVRWEERDVARDGWPGGPYDALLLDLPEPWAVAAVTHDALVQGGHAVAYVPTYNQLERCVRSFREVRFDEVGALEILERPLHVGDGGTRPSFEMLGHTGFLAHGRRVDAG